MAVNNQLARILTCLVTLANAHWHVANAAKRHFLADRTFYQENRLRGAFRRDST